jgi:hypothetical protein
MIFNDANTADLPGTETGRLLFAGAFYFGSMPAFSTSTRESSTSFLR